MKPLVSILIPAYNAERWIADTINSALSQTWPSKEIIVVDDGSTDRTASVVSQFAARGVVLHTQSNQGAAAARNKAYSLCRGDYIQWLDADDLLACDKISQQLDVFSREANNRLIFSAAWGSFYYRTSQAIFAPSELWSTMSPVDWLVLRFKTCSFMPTTVWLVSRELTEAAGPWDTRLLGDDDGEYFFRVIMRSEGIRFVPDARIFYRRTGPGSLSYVGGSNRKMDAHLLGMKLQIQYLLSMKDDEQVRASCLNYLQVCLRCFYPNRPDLVEQAQQLARSLGGQLFPPRLSWKYAWVQKTLGWSVAKMVEQDYNNWKSATLRAWDKAWFQMGINHSRESRKAATNAESVVSTSLPIHADPEKSNQEHFQTDHLLVNLKGRTVSSGVVTIAAQGSQFVLTLISTMILARLLTPLDFGLVAMVWTVMSFLRIFKEAGLSTATIQREGITHAQVSNLFWINLAVSGSISLLVIGAAPLIAWFYREPRLIGITIGLAVTFLMAGMAVQHMALLNRQMRFKVIGLIQVGSVLAGVLVGVGMAWLHYGYWSLVGMNVMTNLVALLMTWTASRWRPQFFTRRSGTRPLIHFGANLTAGSFLYSLARGMDSLMIGRFYGAVSVGIYSRAAAMLFRPVEQFIYPIETVFLPALSRLQSQPENYRRTFVQIYETTALVTSLFTGLLFSLARPLTFFLLGAKWENVVPIFAGFTFAALLYPITTSAQWLFTTQGRGRESLIAISIISIISLGSFAVGLPYGPVGVAWAYSASCLLIQMPVLYWLAGRRGPVNTGDLWVNFLRQFPVWGVTALVTWLICIPIPDNQPVKELLIATPVSLLAGAAFIFIYSPSRQVALNLISMMRELNHAGPKPKGGKAVVV